MDNFVPVVMPEIAAPTDAAACMRCELNKQRKRVIWGEGYPGAPLMVVLDNPVAREDTEGNPYVCGTRETLQRGLTEAGIALEEVFITYILKCRPLRAYDKPLARESCMPFLDRQLLANQPQLVLCLGNMAVQAFFDNDEKEVKSMRGELHLSRGMPTIISYHPLAVRRRPNLYRLFSEDCRLAAETMYAARRARG